MLDPGDEVSVLPGFKYKISSSLRGGSRDLSSAKNGTIIRVSENLQTNDLIIEKLLL
jgi:hypothetical protein